MSTILLAGATGNLGHRIAKALLAKGTTVRALVRAGSDADVRQSLTDAGAELVEADMTDADALRQACQGADCVVSALAGLEDVIVGTQTQLLEAAVAAGVPRFIPSDFASDFTRLPAGQNRNFDLRRTFMERVDKSGIQATSILNGAFAEVLAYNKALLDRDKHTVGYWGDDPGYRIDFTTMDDTAAYTAEVALDASTPRLLRIASFQVSPRELADTMGAVTGEPFALVRMGSLDELAERTRQARAADPAGEQQLYPRWQQMQYMLSMFSVQNQPLDNARFPALSWMPARTWLAQAPPQRG